MFVFDFKISNRHQWKKIMKSYSKQIAWELDRRIMLYDTKIKLWLSSLKPFHAKWLVDTFQFMTCQAGNEVIPNGWKAAGITGARSKRLNGLESLDPSESMHPLVELNVTAGCTLRKKCLYSELLWAIFSRIWTEYRVIRSNLEKTNF